MALTQVDQGLLSSTAQYTGFKNRLINGAMVIDQRNAGASVTPANLQYSVDRWQAQLTQNSKFTLQQNAGSVTPPAGFSKYLGATSSSAYSVLTGDYFALVQGIEGFNTADFAWGTANASPVTLSFKVYSSLTGTFGGALAGGPQSYPFTYSVPVANTWTTITVTIPGSTSGSWATNNTASMYVSFGLGVGATYSGTAGAWSNNFYFTATGATSVVGTNGATFYITGVQLEKGSTATSFDYRPYGTELSLCQRYAVVFTSINANDLLPGLGTAYSATHVIANIPLPVTPRINNPSVSSSGTWSVADGVTPYTATVIASGGTAINSVCIDFTVASGLTSFRPYYQYAGGAGGKITVSMEL